MLGEPGLALALSSNEVKLVRMSLDRGYRVVFGDMDELLSLPRPFLRKYFCEFDYFDLSRELRVGLLLKVVNEEHYSMVVRPREGMM
jgi:hypothetical protein